MAKTPSPSLMSLRREGGKIGTAPLEPLPHEIDEPRETRETN